MLSTYHTLKVKILKGKGKPPIKIFFSKLYYEFLRLIGDYPPTSYSTLCKWCILEGSLLEIKK